MSRASGTMMSNVGNPQTYNGGDQRCCAQAEQVPAYHAGTRHAHQDLDPKDERTLANRLRHQEMHGHDEAEPNTVTDPLKPALDQGHQPSRGAQIDKELQEEDEEILRKKGIKSN
ncbi:hypothetical protein K488DRAFT_46815 [Vararia minispora EC-137]|uniref:Uncharacterized protein n=1 Tax=Vararia minispora EC-137 TaxID=1314806 RepID=A0ACB8QQX2_9AGAM|nr:hypothetical protein K488DRAFT_46815 [Vararia minispora EC-137]